MRKTLICILSLLPAVVAAEGYQVISTGNAQGARTGRILEEPLLVYVSDSVSGIPIPDAQVFFTITSGDGELLPLRGMETVSSSEENIFGETVTNLIVRTDYDGKAGIRLKVGNSMEEISVMAEISTPDGFILGKKVIFGCVAIDVTKLIFEVIGGLAIFLLGMRMMSEGLQRVAGNSMKSLLRRMTSNRILGLLTGALATAVIQSSSATSVITVGLVNTGLMSLQQSIGVILGANIGTTITGQLIAFKITDYAFPMIAVGFVFLAFSKNRKHQFWGRVVVGLGLLFLGMLIMKDVIQPIRSSAPVREVFARFSTSPILAIMAGTLVTMAVQSSSATVGLTMTLAGSGLIGLQGAVFLVLGDNIGTTVTAQLAAIGAGRSARRTAMAHSLFNVIGAVYFAFILMSPGSWFLHMVETTSGNIMRQVANAHSIFNIFNVLVFLPFVPLLTRLCRIIIPGEEIEHSDTEVYLDEGLLSSPVLALEGIEREVVKMARVAGNSIAKGTVHFMTGQNRSEDIFKIEDQVDGMQRDITIYSSKLFQQNLSVDLSLKLPVLLHTINDLERVSDHAVNIVEARGRINLNLETEDGPLSELARKATKIVTQMSDKIVIALEKNSLDAAQHVLKLEEKLNFLEERAREKYGESLTEFGLADLAGLAILDFILFCERAGDHYTNIAQSIIGGGVWHGESDLT